MIIANGIGVPFSTGGGSAPVNPDFVFEVDTTLAGSASDTFVLPLQSSGVYNFDVDWGDTNKDTITVYNQSEVTHVYSSGGTYTITITGQIEGWRFNSAGDDDKITDISNWGSLVITSDRAFTGCSALDITATDAPTITATSLGYMFQSCSLLTTPDFSAWDTSGVTSMYGMFWSASAFNGDVSTWDVSSVTSLGYMFFLAADFNNDISGWDTSSNLNMQNMFKQAYDFNQDISGWDTSKVTSAAQSFSQCFNFNQPIGAWDVTSVTTFFKALENCDDFDQSLAGWDISGAAVLTSLMVSSTGISTANYDATLIAWDAQGSMAFSGTVNFGGSKYTSGGAAEAARTSLISKWGGIIDGGAA